MSNAISHKTIVIVSLCHIDWGGSEELWGLSAKELLQQGHRIVIYKSKINRSHPRFQELISMGAVAEDYTSATTRLNRAASRLQRSAVTLRSNRPDRTNMVDHTEVAFDKVLSRYQPDLVLISQGINFDGLHHAYQCLLKQIPYTIVSQKAVDFFWPKLHERTYMTTALEGAKKCFFVSSHNQKLTEQQFGIKLKNSEVIFNPVKISTPVPYPNDTTTYRLACVARLFLLDKGQDMLIRIMSSKKWQSRPIHISFIGGGDDLEPLKAMASHLNVKNIEFLGHVDDINKVWQNHHALILPSRSEGLPLSIVEAMAAARPVIITRAGGNAELVEEGITGFIGAADDNAFDITMEKAWEARNMWKTMGEKAAEYVQSNIPEKPELEFVEQLKKLLND